MLRAVLLDLDETLCATSKANDDALVRLTSSLKQQFPSLDAERFGERYVQGFYKQLNDGFPELKALLDDESAFRYRLIALLFEEQGVPLASQGAVEIQTAFDNFRMECFGYFPEIEASLVRLRERYKLVVITNGPVFSQRPKVEAVALASRVDAIIVGGEEPEEKPALSIFEKALKLAGCSAHEAIHVGDSFECDIKGANNAGIPSVWVTKPSIYAECLESSLASYVVFSPSDIEQTIIDHAELLNC
ncbi:HAD family hydrolase [Enterovibrio norvegicus]|uniref:HAD family hydrolase n=1 Tax=Enterovibrio norvegicus TaxID=188144 RepID=UPI0002EFBC27|nr:HAD-IA family hydrolase [Enterovibrio norvegicus]OEF58594.1 HAD family hydrolase [Enterovibrio norvegicus]